MGSVCGSWLDASRLTDSFMPIQLDPHYNRRMPFLGDPKRRSIVLLGVGVLLVFALLDGLIGARLPHLTYMLSFADEAELDAKWDVFRNDPAWKRLSTDPRYAYDQIVNNITNVILSPLACSQV